MFLNRLIAILPSFTRGADALVQKWIDTWDQSSKTYTVPYYFMSSYPEEYKDPIRMALQEFQASTCIRFLEISEESSSVWPASIQVHRGEDGPEQLEGCWSHLGKEQTIQLLSLSGGIKHSRVFNLKIHSRLFKHRDDPARVSSRSWLLARAAATRQRRVYRLS